MAFPFATEKGTSGYKSPRRNPVEGGDNVLDRREPLQIRGEHAARGFLAFLKRLAIKGPQVGSQVQAIFLGRRTQHDFPHRYTRRSLFAAGYDSTWNHCAKSMFNGWQTCRSSSVHLDPARIAPPVRRNRPFGVLLTPLPAWPKRHLNGAVLEQLRSSCAAANGLLARLCSRYPPGQAILQISAGSRSGFRSCRPRSRPCMRWLHRIVPAWIWRPLSPSFLGSPC